MNSNPADGLSFALLLWLTKEENGKMYERYVPYCGKALRFDKMPVNYIQHFYRRCKE